MVISYHKGERIKVSFGATVLVFNPISKESQLPAVRFGADIALISLNDKDFNGVEQVTHGDKTPFVIHGPGEYEVQKIFIKGFPSTSEYGLPADRQGKTDTAGGSSRVNTVYMVTLEGMNVCFLGAFSLGPEKKINPKLFEDIDEIDILFVPIGGDGVLSPAEAHDVAVSLQPKIIIPMHYETLDEKNALSVFLKEGGSEGVKPIDKLTIKRKDVEGKNGDIVVLSS